VKNGRRRRIPVREEVRCTLIALLASEPDGVHAYELDRRLRVLSEGFWTPYSGEISRTLHQLEDDGDISSRWQLEDGRPKRVFTATAHGAERLDGWLDAEVSSEPRPLHERLWYRFVAHRARRRPAAEMARDVHVRRRVCLEELRRLEERLATAVGSEGYAPFVRVALRIRELDWKTELGFLEEIQRELADATERSASERRPAPSNDGAVRERDARRRRRDSGRRESALA